jgi:hypothetical protein
MGAGVITLLVMLLVAPFEMWQARAQKWRQLDQVEQNLRRASHGFLLILMIIVGPFVVFGARDVGKLLPSVITHPAAILVVGGLLAYGIVRFLVGVRRVAGLRDELRIGAAFARLAISGVIAAFLFATYPWGASGWLFAGLVLAFWISLLNALNGAVRLVVLSVGGSNAQRMIARNIRERNAPMRPANAGRPRQ